MIIKAMHKIYLYYTYRIFPEVNHIRGTTRLKLLLKKPLYKGIEKIEREPESIFSYDEEWDNLFIADACRFDLFNEVYPEKEAEKRVSLGSSSAEYVRKTYSDGDYSDVVYVTGNPHFAPVKFRDLTGRKVDDVFHEVYHTWETDWIEGLGRPSTKAIMRDAREARKKHPDKRLVVHFMKPHHPFHGFDFEGFDQELDGTFVNSVWAAGERGDIPWEEVWNGYKYNLREIYPKLESLGRELDGDTVVTSDHGNFVGENGLGHHPGKRREKPVRHVPWVRIR